LAGRRRLLWRVRRRLILSYILIGVVPVILIVTFFVLAGLLLFTNLSAYLIRGALEDLSQDASYLAGSTALELDRLADPSRTAAMAVLERRQSGDATGYPGISIAVLAVDPARCFGAATSLRPPPAGSYRALAEPIQVGPWRHLAVPRTLPEWIGCRPFSGVLAYDANRSRNGQEDVRLVVRAVAVPD
jgi:hypothetical protein